MCCPGLWLGESSKKGGKEESMWAGAGGMYPVAVQWGCGREPWAAQAVNGTVRSDT